MPDQGEQVVGTVAQRSGGPPNGLLKWRKEGQGLLPKGKLAPQSLFRVHGANSIYFFNAVQPVDQFGVHSWCFLAGSAADAVESQ